MQQVVCYIIVFSNPFERNFLFYVCNVVNIVCFCNTHIRIIRNAFKNYNLSGFTFECGLNCGTAYVKGFCDVCISVGNCFRMYNSAFGETPQVYADFLSPYVISLILMFIILFGYSILALYRSEHIGIRTALADVGITAVAILVYFVHERNNIMEIYDLDYFLTHIGEFAMYWRVVMLAVAVFLFLKYAILIESTRKKFKEIIDMFFSEAERYSLPWVRSAFYGAIMVGILAIVCVAVNSQTLFVFFVVVLLTFMFIFVVSYLMYPITYFDISSVIEAPESLRMRLEEEMGSTEKIDEKM